MIRLLEFTRPVLLLFLLLALGCHQPDEDCNCDDESATLFIDTSQTKAIDTLLNGKEEIRQTCKLAHRLRSSGLVNIQKIIPTIQVELKYSTQDNFMHADVYGCLDSCFLQRDVAEKLKKAQKLLRKINGNYTLLVYDGVRPRSVQQAMWDTLKMPFEEKIKFVSNPKNGSLHNYGAAVDLTIFDNIANRILDMGTPYDYIGELAWPTKESEMLKAKKLTQVQVDNRKLLRKVMYDAGFFNIQTEWWHFNSCRREIAKQKYEIIE